MSLNQSNRRKLKAVATYANNQKWDAVLLSEVNANGQGIVWLGSKEGNDLTAITYTNKAAILLRIT